MSLLILVVFKDLLVDCDPCEDKSVGSVFGKIVVCPFQDGMEQESQQVESDQQRGQVLFAMAVIVFEMVAL